MPALRTDLLTILKNELENHYIHHLPSLLDQSSPIQEQKKKNIDRAFSAFTLRAICSVPVREVAKSVIDDFNDNGIDAIYFEKNSKVLYLVQSKLEAKDFREAEAQTFVEGLRLILNSQFSAFNQNVLNRQSEIQSALHDADKIILVVCYTGHQVSTHAKNCLERFIESESENEDRLQSDIVYFDSSNVEDFLLKQQSYQEVSEKIDIYNFVRILSPRKTLYGQVKLKDLVKLHENYQLALYQQNIRYFIGGNTSPNKAIKNTLNQEADNFFFYNNGITALCSDFTSAGSFGENGKNRKYKIRNLSVVNGAQTIATAYDYYKENGNQISDDAKVLLTIIQADSGQDIGKKITQNRNNQNPVDLTDFIALDDQQERLRREIKYFGYEYFYRPTALSSTANAITVDEAMRSLAMLEKNSIYPIKLKNNATLMLDLNSLEYQQVFSNALTGLKLLNTVLLYRQFNHIWNGYIGSTTGQEKLIYKHANFVAFYIFSKRFKKELDKPVLASMTNLPANVSAELDKLRLLIFNKTSSRLAGVSPNTFFKNSSSTVSVLTDAMIEHFGKTSDRNVLGMMRISATDEPYPKANLVNYLTDNAPQLTLGTGTP